jgi:DNA-binding transcriptional ArsR family regulator
MELMNQTFAALADPTRRGIIARLAEGEATVSELVDRFDLTQPTISSHIKVLETAGLISRSRRGQTRPCKLEPDGLRAVNGWLAHLRTVWETNFGRLDDLLEELKVQTRKRSGDHDARKSHDPL